MNIDIPNNWEPREYQLPVWKYLHRGGKRAVCRWHRRAGKDDVFLNYMACAAHERVGNYWYMLPEAAQARKAMWDAINPKTGVKRLDQAFPAEIRSSKHEQEMKIGLKCGSSVQIVGSDNFNSLVGSPPVGLVFSEYAVANPASWAYLMPILEENGGWACFNSTTRGKNHFFKLCAMAEQSPGWFYDVRTADQTGIFSADQLQRIRTELHNTYGPDFGEAMFQQEYFVSFEAAILGSIWGDCLAKLEALGRIGSVPYNPAYPVHCAYDLGSTDATAIWFFQIIGQDIHIINFHESHHKSVEFYCHLLRDLSKNLGYRYSTQWLPHDAVHGHLAAGGKSIRQQFIDEAKSGDLGKFKQTPNLSKEQGIQAARATFPRCKFDDTLCEDGIEALKFYHHKYDDEKKCFTKEPEHDWSSHAADGWRYLSLVWKEARAEPEPMPIDQQLINHSIQSISMGSLTKQHLKRMRQQREGAL